MEQLPKKLPKFFCYFLRPYIFQVVGLIAVMVILAIQMAVSPYILKCIIDAVASYEGDIGGVFSVLIAPVCWYVFFTFSIGVSFRIRDWFDLILFPSIRKDIITSDY